MSFLNKEVTDGMKKLFRSRKELLKALLFSFSGGVLFAAALPPLNWWWAGFFALAPLVWCAARMEWKRAALCGWVWGLGWSLFAFQFLREIEFIVPYLLAPVISVWPAVAAGLISGTGRRLLYTPEGMAEDSEKQPSYLSERLPWYRTLLFIFCAAVIYTLAEWTRSRLFTWNDLSVTQWRNLPFIQICSVTGSYGVLFLTALGGAALGSVTLRYGRHCLAGVLLLLLGNWFWGYHQLNNVPYVTDREWKTAPVQGDLSQRRHAGEKEFREALETYIKLSYDAAKLDPSVIIWPESAIPMPLRSSHPFALEYAAALKKLIVDCRKPMLIGALDFSPPPPGKKEYGFTNSALYIEGNWVLRYKYDKIHRVPYGEYIPFRHLLPEFLIRMIDMGRDLTSGTNMETLDLPGGPKVSTAICYEGVFGYLTRQFAFKGAEVLTVLSNDAWYPRSSEPEQHLANALMRAVETGVPMLRCGNNGGTGVVDPRGRLLGFLDVPDQPGRREIKRGRAAGIVTVRYKASPEKTFYVRHGEWFILFLGLLFAGLLGTALITRLRYCSKLPESGFILRKRHRS